MATKIELEEHIEELEDACAAVVDILTDPNMSDSEKIAEVLDFLSVDELDEE